ncbi:hypothetical protein EJB05_52067, partial [Eragrostis curvula]
MATVMQKIKDIEDEVLRFYEKGCSIVAPVFVLDAKIRQPAYCGDQKLLVLDGKDQKNKATAHHLGLLKSLYDVNRVGSD